MRKIGKSKLKKKEGEKKRRGLEQKEKKRRRYDQKKKKNRELSEKQRKEEIGLLKKLRTGTIRSNNKEIKKNFTLVLKTISIRMFQFVFS